jgi:ribonuclease Z
VIEITLLGTGNPLPDPNRAGPATLVRAGSVLLLVDCGRGVLMRLAAAGVGAGALSALLLTHLHSDHITDLGDVITTRWVSTFTSTPLTIVGPPGTRAVVDATLASLAQDIGYRLAHHEDLHEAPVVEVTEVSEGPAWSGAGVEVVAAPTDHRPVVPTIGFRVEHEGASVVLAGDTVPCASLDRLAAGAGALVHTAIRKDILSSMGLPRLEDVCDYHSSVEEAADTASRAGVGILVLTHYVPSIAPGQEDAWRAIAATAFAGPIELGDDLHRVEVHAPG